MLTLRVFANVLLVALVLLGTSQSAHSQQLRIYNDEGFGLQFSFVNVGAGDVHEDECIEFNAWLNGVSIGTFELGWIWDSSKRKHIWTDKTEVYDVTTLINKPTPSGSEDNILTGKFTEVLDLDYDWFDRADSKETLMEFAGGDITIPIIYAQFYRDSRKMLDAKGSLIGVDEIESTRRNTWRYHQKRHKIEFRIR